MEKKGYIRPGWLHYSITQAVAFCFATLIFRRKFLRNEIRNVKGPFVVIANHQAAYDFINLIGATRRRMSFVVSNSFYNSLPIHDFMERLGVIPKQQFQTTVNDMKKIRAVVDSGNPLVIYPAGLMCEDGLSTPVAKATYKFLKWLNVDVYMAKTSGTYFAMPKWNKGFRPGRTYMDIYKLFSKEELAQLPVSEIRQRAEEALLFDAYREQETLRVKYAKNNNLEGLQNVLYMCPHCDSEFTIEVDTPDTIRCRSCGFEERSDEFAFLHNEKGIGPEIRYVSDWSRYILNRVKRRIRTEREFLLSSKTKIHMLDYQKHCFREVGDGTLSLDAAGFTLNGTVNGQSLSLTIPSEQFPSLPFTPGRHLELQNGSDIYRCVLQDGRLVMKFIHLLKASYELRNSESVSV